MTTNSTTTTATLTEDEEREIEARCAAATPGPWSVCGANDGHCICGLVWAPDGEHTVAVAQADDYTRGRQEDASFIAHARTYVPRLLAALRAERVRADAFGMAASAGKRVANDLREEVERHRALVFRLWDAAVLSEGQVAKVLGVDRLTAREMRDTAAAIRVEEEPGR